MSAPWLGIIADDTTGACDVAGGLAGLGMATTLLLGVPDGPLVEQTDCVIIGLTTRTARADHAVVESVASGRWLLAAGVTQLYQKYCSTFDSTDRGNIGPVAEALADLVGSGISAGTPATPQAGRTQYCGQLFVDGTPLAESSMREHPLTPMTDSNLVRVLQRQSSRPVSLLHRGEPFVSTGLPRQVLVDAVDDADLDRLAANLAVADPPVLVGGGAGLALALARRRGGAATVPPSEPIPDGGRLILCGSGSARTREQIASFAGPIISFDPLGIARDADAGIARLANKIAALHDLDPEYAILVAAANEPNEVRAVQARLGIDGAAALVERVLGALAVRAVEELGVRRVIVAGGETSGAITTALGITRLSVRGLAAPGVPWAVGQRPNGTPIALLLKSGNFGHPELFTTAWETSP